MSAWERRSSSTRRRRSSRPGWRIATTPSSPSPLRPDVREAPPAGRGRADGAPAPGGREGGPGGRRLRELRARSRSSTPSSPASSSGSCGDEAGRSSRWSRSPSSAAPAYAWVDHTQPAWWVRLRYPLYYRDSIVGYGHKYHLDPALIAAVVYEESRLQGELALERRRRSASCSSCRRRPAASPTHTGGTKFDPRHDLYDADLNLRYGSWYLAHLRQKYAGRPNAGDLALAAYNAGQANVDDWIAETPAGQPRRRAVPGDARLRRRRPPPARRSTARRTATQLGQG